MLVWIALFTGAIYPHNPLQLAMYEEAILPRSNFIFAVLEDIGFDKTDFMYEIGKGNMFWHFRYIILTLVLWYQLCGSWGII